MCLAPCFKGCSDEDYAEEVIRVRNYFESNGDSLLREISAQRDQASANLEFENAAALHARLEKLHPLSGAVAGDRPPHRPAQRADRSAQRGQRNAFASSALTAGRAL